MRSLGESCSVRNVESAWQKEATMVDAKEETLVMDSTDATDESDCPRIVIPVEEVKVDRIRISCPAKIGTLVHL
jgi:hypothetical protein